MRKIRIGDAVLKDGREGEIVGLGRKWVGVRWKSGPGGLSRIDRKWFRAAMLVSRR